MSAQKRNGEYDEEVPECHFSNPDPYAKVEPRPDDAPKREFTFDEKGNIVVKNLSAFWLPDVKIVDEIGGTEYTVTGSYTTLTELTPYALRELVKAVYVEAPDKSSGKRKQKVHIEYDLVGYIPVDELIKAEQA